MNTEICKLPAVIIAEIFSYLRHEDVVLLAADSRIRKCLNLVPRIRFRQFTPAMAPRISWYRCLEHMTISKFGSLKGLKHSNIRTLVLGFRNGYDIGNRIHELHWIHELPMSLTSLVSLTESILGGDGGVFPPGLTKLCAPHVLIPDLSMLPLMELRGASRKTILPKTLEIVSYASPTTTGMELFFASDSKKNALEKLPPSVTDLACWKIGSFGDGRPGDVANLLWIKSLNKLKKASVGQVLDIRCLNELCCHNLTSLSFACTGLDLGGLVLPPTIISLELVLESCMGAICLPYGLRSYKNDDMCSSFDIGVLLKSQQEEGGVYIEGILPPNLSEVHVYQVSHIIPRSVTKLHCSYYNPGCVPSRPGMGWKHLDNQLPSLYSLRELRTDVVHGCLIDSIIPVVRSLNNLEVLSIVAPTSSDPWPIQTKKVKLPPNLTSLWLTCLLVVNSCLPGKLKIITVEEMRIESPLPPSVSKLDVMKMVLLPRVKIRQGMDVEWRSPTDPIPEGFTFGKLSCPQQISSSLGEQITRLAESTEIVFGPEIRPYYLDTSDNPAVPPNAKKLRYHRRNGHQKSSYIHISHEELKGIHLGVESIDFGEGLEIPL
jgi:hypothetical protein